jgi:hypothetical protein
MIALTAVIACVKLKTSVARIAGPQQRHDDLAQRAHRGAAQRRRRLVERLVDLRQRGDARAHADRHVAEHEAQHEDQHPAGELERRHVERDDVRHADHRAGIAKLTIVRNSNERRPAKRCAVMT